MIFLKQIFNKKMLLIFFIISGVFCFSNEKIKDLNKEIEYLEEVKRGFESKATQLENKAQDLQFQNNNLQDAKRYWKMADSNRQAAEEVEKKIQQKKKERDRLLK